MTNAPTLADLLPAIQLISTNVAALIDVAALLKERVDQLDAKMASVAALETQLAEVTAKVALLENHTYVLKKY